MNSEPVPFACSECDTKLFELPTTFLVVGSDSESAMSHATVSSTVKFYLVIYSFLELSHSAGGRAES